ncbi:MAG: hypothetical protein NC898_03785 [Candidatus Omnitrophica bacterium]|nr:hypothetical protein [Candidatus Omnitrophota bacterium]MCM8793570.1 hypothetical protein [Candidatus Omnitrophota bacterium]
MKRNGFTLMGIILVIILLGILGITFTIKFSGFAEVKLSSAISKLASDIAYAQQLSLTTQLYHGISFDTVNEKYSLFCETTDNLIKDPYTGEDFIVDYTKGEFQGVNLHSVNIDGGREILFNWEGIPCNSAKTKIIIEATITLEYEGRTKTLSVVAETGKVNW